MDDDLNFEEVHNGFRELFKEAFTTNCLLDDSVVTPEEIATLNELDIQEVLVNFKELVNSLLTFKRTYRTTEPAALVQQVQEFEALLQKAEAEIRSHIGVEQQLKLHIDLTQSQLDEVTRKYAKAKATIQGGRAPLKAHENFSSKTRRPETAEKKEPAETKRPRSSLGKDSQEPKEARRASRDWKDSKDPAKKPPDP